MDDYYLVEEASDDDSYTTGDADDHGFRFDIEADLKSDDEEEEEDFDDEMKKELVARSKAVGTSEPPAEEGPSKSTEVVEGLIQPAPATANATTNADDELFYDPLADEEDEKWVNSQRAGGSLRRNIQGEPVKKGANSDAVLNCPGCMCLLTLDCQRHEIYKTQYRAMFVFNCDINFSEKLSFKGKKRKSGHGSGSAKRNEQDSKNFQLDETAATKSSDLYYNVNCSVCKTQIAVCDEDEVFHFFNTLASF